MDDEETNVAIEYELDELKGDSFEMEYSEDLISKDKQFNRPKCKISRGVIILLLVTLILIVLVIVGTTTTLVFVLWGESPPPYFSSSDVKNTIEFQIDLKPKTDWENREEMVNYWIQAINQNTTLFQIQRENATEDVYMEYHLIATSDKRCSLSEDIKIRFRAYVYSQENTIDLKSKEDTWLRACSEPFWPAEEYYANSKQKCEEDFHPCFEKHTRGSSVYFDDPRKSFPYCKDLLDVFPYAFPTITEENAMNRVAASVKTYWWKLNWKIPLDYDMMFEITFTMKYDNVQQAEGSISSPINEGEWSGRLYSPTDSDMNEDILSSIENLYYRLVLQFDTTNDEHIECANYYFGYIE